MPVNLSVMRHAQTLVASMLSTLAYAMPTQSSAQPVEAAVVQQSLVLQGIPVDIFQIKNLSQLKLFLYSADSQDKQKPINHIQKIKKELTHCESLLFAMNAGMFHADYTPVGLYIENGHQYTPINTQTGFGNFFLAPNGVLAWNDQYATITTTQHFTQQNFQANYATQSGPMLVLNGAINPLFLPQSDSLKIRNGVGIKDNTLYFVISHKPINFYQFAQIFVQQLQVESALYLDGTLSSVYFNQNIWQANRRRLGPMLGYVGSIPCKP